MDNGSCRKAAPAPSERGPGIGTSAAREALMEANIHIPFGGLAVFAALGAIFMALPIVAGYFLRPKVETPQKRTVYECGEPTIGSSWIRYNIRFYSTALDFLIFDVEVVLLLPAAVALVQVGKALGRGAALSALGVMSFFFLVLALGLAYAWRWGSIDWIRGGEPAQEGQPSPAKAVRVDEGEDIVEAAA
jgi:NADH-quinone oxidoreductase subunit A